MTGKQILIKARQSRIAALENLKVSRTSRCPSTKMPAFRTRRFIDACVLEETLFRAYEERLQVA